MPPGARTRHSSGGSPTGTASRPAGGEPPVLTARVEAKDGTEVYFCARPDPDAAGFAEQARSTYENLRRELRRLSIGPEHLIFEKMFLSDLSSQVAALRTVRKRFHGPAARSSPLPAFTSVLQPPAVPPRLCELQALAFLSSDGSAAPMRCLEGLPPYASGRMVHRGNVLLLHLANLTAGDGLDLTRRPAELFRLAEVLLEREGLSFRDVVRTWIYLPEMYRDYDALNQARREFYQSRGVRPFPASTGIQGRIPPDGSLGMDVLAMAGPGIQAEPIHAPTMNEAGEYGSFFSRGIRVRFPDRSLIYLSGTASIDIRGEVVHVGDAAGQIDRMMTNVEQLLAGQGAGFRDLVSVTTYLKHQEDCTRFLSECRRRGIPEDIPHTVCVAEVCRPTWLCEMEAIAALGGPSSAAEAHSGG